MDLEKLEKLNKLRQDGALTEDEYLREKHKLMEEEACPDKETIMGVSPREYAAIINFILFIPSIGWIASIILWLVGRDKSPMVNEQGKYLVNWMLTWMIIGIIVVVSLSVFSALAHPEKVKILLLVLCLLVLAGMVICAIVFPVLAGIKCMKGATWRYPLAITFIK